ncbi:MAG TPA: HNH endonuclease [Candidatus Krumholzibacteria bacterium]
MSAVLRSLSDHELLSRTRALTAQERKVTLSLLLHLNEIERRSLYLKQGYSSLFDYCTSHLKLSESAAMRRIKTARCIARFPEVCALLEAGDVNLSTVSRVSAILTATNKDDVLMRIKGKSQRDVDAVVAEYAPRAAVPPDRVRTVMVPVAALGIRTPRVANDECNEIYRRSGGKDSATSEGETRTARSPKPETEMLAVIEFSARAPFMKKMRVVRSLAAHRLQGAVSFEHVFELLMDYFIEREDPERRHQRRESRAGAASKAPHENTDPRNIPAHIRDQVFVRDGGRCTYIGANGKQCESTHALQVDHIIPVARGGTSNIENLRLLCAKHNRLEAERLMGQWRPENRATRPEAALPASH